MTAYQTQVILVPSDLAKAGQWVDASFDYQCAFGGVHVTNDPGAANLGRFAVVTVVGGRQQWGRDMVTYVKQACPAATVDFIPASMPAELYHALQERVTLGKRYGATEIPPPPTELISGITPTTRRIFVQGVQRGNRGNVFAKVGDSITDNNYFLRPIGWGRYNLRRYEDLWPAVTFFTADSYGRTSFAARGGWTARHVLDPSQADRSTCRAGETPLVCEYRVTRPAVSIIMFGTNDSGGLPVDEFNTNMRRIVQITLDMGIIPVLNTIPPKNAFPPTDGRVVEFNRVIINIARAYDIPLIDYWRAMSTLPGMGLSADGVHPSWPPGGENSAADFTEENLRAGHTVRNLLTLQMLDALWRYVLHNYRGT